MLDTEINSQSNNGDLLIRLDERTKNISETLKTLSQTISDVESKLHQGERDRDDVRQRLENQVETTRQRLQDSVEATKLQTKADLEKNYVKKAEFSPIQRLVYGFVGFLLLAIGGMFIAVITHPNTNDKQAIIIPSQQLPPVSNNFGNQK